MAENYNILPTRGPQQLDSLKISPETMLSNIQKAQDRRFEKQKWKAQQPNTMDKILSYAGTALDMYNKWTDIETKKLDQENTKLQQQVDTLKLEQARIQAQTQNTKLEKDTKYAKELTAAMESGDANAVYSVMMSNLEGVKNNPELTQMATEFCISKGMDRESFDVFNPTEAAMMRKIQAQTAGKIAVEEAKAKNSALTLEQKANEAATKEAEKASLNFGNSVSTNPTLSSAILPIAPTITTPNGMDDFKQAIYNGEISCSILPNYEEEVGKLFNSSDSVLSGYEQIISPYTKLSDNPSDTFKYPQTTENNTDIQEGPAGVTVADTNKLSAIFICTNNKTGNMGVIPLNKEDSANFQKLLGEGARRRKIQREVQESLITTDINNPDTTEESQNDAITQNYDFSESNPNREQEVNKVVADIRAKIQDPNEFEKIIQPFVDNEFDNIENPNEVLKAYIKARYVDKVPIKEAKKAAKNIVKGRLKKPTTENKEEKESANVTEVVEETAETPIKKQSLLDLKQEYNRKAL